MELVAEGVEHEALAGFVDRLKRLVGRDVRWHGHAGVVGENDQALTARSIGRTRAPGAFGAYGGFRLGVDVRSRPLPATRRGRFQPQSDQRRSLRRMDAFALREK